MDARTRGSPNRSIVRRLPGFSVALKHRGAGARQFQLLRAIGQRILFPLAQLNSTTRSSGLTSPRSSAERQPASTAPPSGQNSMPSSRATSSTACRIESSSTAMAAPPLSRTARRIRKSPTALGTQIPDCRRRRAFPALGELVAPFERADDRCAAGRLDRVHARALRPDQACGLELVEALPHANQAGAAAGRIEDRVRQGPAELLGKLEPHHFLALEAVRLLEGRAVEPAALGRPFADQAARTRRSDRPPPTRARRKPRFR